jgi:hypothetical protein
VLNVVFIFFILDSAPLYIIFENGSVFQLSIPGIYNIRKFWNKFYYY